MHVCMHMTTKSGFHTDSLDVMEVLTKNEVNFGKKLRTKPRSKGILLNLKYLFFVCVARRRGIISEPNISPLPFYLQL